MMESKIKVELIKNYIEQNNLNNTTFSRLCGISPVTLKKIFNGQEVRFTVLFTIAHFIDVKLADLIIAEQDV